MSHMFCISRPVALFLVLIAARDVYSTTVQKQPPAVYRYRRFVSGKLFTTSADLPEITVFGELLSNSRETLNRIVSTVKPMELVNDVSSYADVALTGFGDDVDKFHVIIGCSGHGEALPKNDAEFGAIDSVPFGVHEVCRIYIFDNDYVKFTNIVIGMPETVTLYVESGDSNIALRFDMSFSPRVGSKEGDSCKEVKNIPYFNAVSEYYTAPENIVDLPVVTIDSKEEGEFARSIDITVVYKEQPMVYSIVKCGVLLTVPLNQDDLIYFFKLGDLDCHVISKIATERKHLVDSFSLMYYNEMLVIYFLFRDPDEPATPFDLVIELYVDGCPAKYGTIAAATGPPAVVTTEKSPDSGQREAGSNGSGESIDTMEAAGSGDESELIVADPEIGIDLSKYSLTEVQFGEIISEDTTTFSKETPNGVLFPIFNPKFQIFPSITGSVREVVDRVVVEYVYSANNELPPNSMLLVLSVLDDRLGILVSCGETDVGENAEISFGKNCAVQTDYIKSKKLTIIEKQTTEGLPILTLNIKDKEGNEFVWRISNVPAPEPNKGGRHLLVKQKFVLENPVAGQNANAPLTFQEAALSAETNNVDSGSSSSETRGYGDDQRMPPTVVIHTKPILAASTTIQAMAAPSTGPSKPQSIMPQQVETNKQDDPNAIKPAVTTRKQSSTTDNKSSQPTNAVHAPTSPQVALKDNSELSVDQGGSGKSAPSPSSSADASAVLSSTPSKKNAVASAINSTFLTFVVPIIAAAIFI